MAIPSGTTLDQVAKVQRELLIGQIDFPSSDVPILTQILRSEAGVLSQRAAVALAYIGHKMRRRTAGKSKISRRKTKKNRLKSRKNRRRAKRRTTRRHRRR